MEKVFYNLDVECSNIGGYLSSEQIDLLRIVECRSSLELSTFVKNCSQIKHRFSDSELERLSGDLDDFKKRVISVYQEVMISHDEKKKAPLKKLIELGLNKGDIVNVALMMSDENRYAKIRSYLDEVGYDSSVLIKMNHELFCLERDQIKCLKIGDISLLGDGISDVDTILIGSGRFYNVVNPFYNEDEVGRYNFYHTKRDLDYAYDHDKQVRYHSLLVRDIEFGNMSREEVIMTLKRYVKESIDFINEYNSSHSDKKRPFINAVDLFNELISFDPMVPCSLDENPLGWREAKRENGRYIEEGEYKNIWELKYQITASDLVEIFEYAMINKPEGVSYLYNEPFLEDSDRRSKVISLLDEINLCADERKRELGYSEEEIESDKFIDTLGTQMHLTIGQDIGLIEDEFRDFRDRRVQITEFDLSLSKNDAVRMIGNPVMIEEVRKLKSTLMSKISDVIRNSNCNLTGVSYWTIIDKSDHNLERIRTSLIEEGREVDAYSLESVCAGRVSEVSSSEKNKINEIK